MADTDWRPRQEDDYDSGIHTRHDSLVDPNTAALAKTSLEDDSFLLSVPGDIRNLIYQHVLFEPDGVHLYFGRAGNTSVVETVTALSAACSSTRSESRDLAYRLNVFHFHLPMLEQQQQTRAYDTDNTAGSRAAPPSVSSSSLALPPQPSSETDPTSNPVRASDATAATATTATATPSAASLRRISQTFYELATTTAKLRAASTHLERAATRLPRALRCVHVQLGSQTQTVAFLPAFHAGWDAVLPSVLALRKSGGVASLRVGFALRVSRRMLLACDFEAKMSSLAAALEEIDAGVRVDGAAAAAEGEVGEVQDGEEAWEATLSEMAAVNEVRAKLAQTLWPAEDVGHWSGR